MGQPEEGATCIVLAALISQNTRSYLEPRKASLVAYICMGNKTTRCSNPEVYRSHISINYTTRTHGTDEEIVRKLYGGLPIMEDYLLQQQKPYT